MTGPSQQTVAAPPAPPMPQAPQPVPARGLTAAQRAADRAIVTVLVGLVLLPMPLGPLALILVHRCRRLGGERLRWVVGVAWIEILAGILFLAALASVLFSLLTMAAHGSAS